MSIRTKGRASPCVLAAAILLLGIAPAFAATQVASPDGRIVVDFIVDQGTPCYSVTFRGKPVLAASELGFEFKGKPALNAGLECVDTKSGTFDETWDTAWGQFAKIRSHYNEMRVSLKEKAKPSRRMDVVFRVFDDGVGFRYELPEQVELKDIEIAKENTHFNFAQDLPSKWIPQDFDTDEFLFRSTPLSDVAAVNTPLTLGDDALGYFSIHEANLRDYAAMTLVKDPARKLSLAAALVPWPDGILVKTRTPMKTPWRVVLVADNPGGLITSTMILNLNEPCVLKDVSWIRPMKYVGIWWGIHIGKWVWAAGPNHGATTENTRKYLDFAARNNIQGVLVEGWNTGWENWGKDGAFDQMTPCQDFDLAGLAKYAKEKGVELIGHHETGGDAPNYDKVLDKAFALCAKHDMNAVKTGYAGGIFPRGQHHYGQWMVEHYQRVVEAAARHKVSIDVHECIHPTGLCRTYPNLMTGEGARGSEWNAWSDGNPPEHLTILPFTRLLAGPMDYTPGIFELFYDQYKKAERVHTTLANQLALMVVIYSPLQMASDLIENYEGHPAFQFIRDLDVDYDDTRVLHAQIGDTVTVARRSGNNWYIGSITDENAREFDAKLDFLEPGKKYEAVIYGDAADADFEKNAAAYEIRRMSVDRSTVLKIKLARGGGQAISIIPAE